MKKSKLPHTAGKNVKLCSHFGKQFGSSLKFKEILSHWKFQSWRFQEISVIGAGNGNLLQYSCWRIPRTEEPGGLQSVGLQASDTT